MDAHLSCRVQEWDPDTLRRVDGTLGTSVTLDGALTICVVVAIPGVPLLLLLLTATLEAKHVASARAALNCLPIWSDDNIVVRQRVPLVIVLVAIVEVRVIAVLDIV
jgi:hypothetical protein